MRKIRSILLAPLFALLLPACETGPAAENPKQYDPNSDTFYIDSRAAVFYAPDSARIQKAKKALGEEDFYTAADDNLWYMNLAHEFVDSMTLRSHNVSDKKFLKFIAQTNSHVVKIDTLEELWGVYFFDPAKKAKRVDILQIDSEYHSYFSKEN